MAQDSNGDLNSWDMSGDSNLHYHSLLLPAVQVQGYTPEEGYWMIVLLIISAQSGMFQKLSEFPIHGEKLSFLGSEALCFR